jgi:hypothetical protein
LHVIVSWYAAGVADLIRLAVSSLSQANDASVVAHALAVADRVAAPLVIPLALVALLAATIMTLIRPEGVSALVGNLVRGGLLVVAAACTPLLALLAIRIVDAVSTGVASGLTAPFATFAHRLGNHPLVTTFGSFALLLLTVLSSLALWLELLIRQLALTVLACSAPLVFALGSSATGRQLARRLVHLFTGVLVSKIVLLFVLVCGVALMSSPGLNAPAVGAITLGFAVWSPLSVLKIVPLLETGGLALADGLRGRVLRSGLVAAAVAGKASNLLPAKLPTPPVEPDDHGIGYWESGPAAELPPIPTPGAAPPPPPIGTPRLPRVRWSAEETPSGPRLWRHDLE